jgi:transcriptional regulator GlxA family with amidase domain
LDIGFLVYPRLTALDLVGPWEILSRLPDTRTHLIWTRPGPVQAERGMEISANIAFDQVPELGMLVIPGGPGQQALMKHIPLMDFIRERARRVEWLCTVCTGAFLAAGAGVLRGRRATTHWLAKEALASYGVDVVDERFVIDGKFASSAGVSAGIDLAFELARRIGGERTAQEIQLQTEYNPRPPLDAGSPERAPKEVVETLRKRTGWQSRAPH